MISPGTCTTTAGVRAISEADRVLLVVDATAPEALDPFALWPEFLEQRPEPGKVTLIRNKADLTGEPIGLQVCDDGHVTISLSAKSAGEGEVVAITRARIKWSQNFRFWKAVPPVTSSLHSSPGLIRTIGIGEAPIGLQGTFSHWRSGADLRNFAYKGAAHQEAIAATERHAWYAEELFARFAVRDIRGSLTQ